MTFRVLSPLTLKTPQGILTLEPGRMIELDERNAAPLVEGGRICPSVTPEEREAFEERSAIMQDSGIPQDQAETLARYCVRPIPLAFVESCSLSTPPDGQCGSYSMKLYLPTMSLKPFCLTHRKWCYDVHRPQQEEQEHARIKN